MKKSRTSTSKVADKKQGKLSSQSQVKSILVEVQIPEAYLDCHPEIIFDDFIENPKSFSVSLKEEK